MIVALLAVDLVLGTVRPLAGWTYGAQYFAGYVVEKSLSVDNFFVHRRLAK
ncbi:hypothetical protein [Streptomyces sp. NPDC029041]|uniref:hypothetical protein n=1 Tax=Streptomyces sp. NPDC029041 TaxID=3155727 RepID=UPI0033F6F428